MVMIGIDPHKRTHTAVAVDDRRSRCSANSWCMRVPVRSVSWSRGLTSSTSRTDVGDRVRGWARLPVGAAAPRRAVNTWWISRRRWRRGCDCWARAGRRRTTRTTHGRSRSPRCGRRCWCRCGSRTTRRCCGCWRVVIRRSRGRATSRCVGSTPWSCELVAGRDRQRSRCFAGVSGSSRTLEPAGAVGRERHRLALELLDDIARFDEQRKASERAIRTAVVASGTTLTEIFGIGDVVAATLIGHTGDVVPVRDRRQVRRVQRHRADRVVVGEPEAADASTVATREPHHEPRVAHRRGHPTPTRAQSRPRVLRPQTRRGPHLEVSDPCAEATDQQHRLPPPRRRRATRHDHTMKRVREGNQGTTLELQRGRHDP